MGGAPLNIFNNIKKKKRIHIFIHLPTQRGKRRKERRYQSINIMLLFYGSKERGENIN
jgi:hypothetical protein